MEFSLPIVVVLVIFVLYILNSIKILAEYERGVIFRLGRLLPGGFPPRLRRRPGGAG